VSNYECNSKDNLIYELHWYVFEVLIGHFGEGEYNKKHISGDKKTMIAVLRFVFDEQWISIMLKFNQSIFLSMIKLLIKSGMKLVVDEFTHSLNRFLEKQRKMKMKEERLKDSVMSMPPPLFEEEDFIDSDDEDGDEVLANPEKRGFRTLRKLWKKLRRKRIRKKKKHILELFRKRSSLNQSHSVQKGGFMKQGEQ
jgi:hypothetical protein